MKYKKIADNIFVYNELFANLSDTIKTVNEKKTWDQWYTFGDKALVHTGPMQFDKFPTVKEWDSRINSLSDILDAEKEILSIFYKTTHHYIETNSIIKDNWVFESPTICRYTHGRGVLEEDGIAMGFHTDFQQEDASAPGPKHVMTCNMYLNDDYDGGEVVFKIFKNKEEFDRVTYKPVAGDVIIFPSAHPYYHGVKVALNGDRYFVRSFWHEMFPGTDEWHKNKEKYGEEVWAEMENKRKHVEQHDGRYLKNDY